MTVTKKSRKRGSAAAKDNSFGKAVLRTGWMYEWNGGVSTLLQASYGYKSY
ncbi:hypothetical protein DSQ34_20200, partial [Salmonella enterica]|nr:hypothetical protein [Salmonella enterica]